MLARVAFSSSRVAFSSSRVAFRTYSSVNCGTKRVFNKFFKNKGFSYNADELTQDEMRSKMALYLINNKDKMHHNYPEVLWELQQYHSVRLRELEAIRKQLQEKLNQLKADDTVGFVHMIEEEIVQLMKNNVADVLNKHRRQIRKVSDVKHQDPNFWNSRVTVKSVLPEE